MIAESIEFKKHRCFKSDWVGFTQIKPINVIIGRNNSGKSHLLDLVEAFCKGQLKGKGWHFRLSGKLDEDSLKQAFPPSHSGGEMRGQHWEYHGKHFVNVPVTWELDDQQSVSNLTFPPNFNFVSPYGEKETEARIRTLKRMLANFRHSLSGKTFCRLLADRDIRPETAGKTLDLKSDGTGATNIIRRFLTTSNPEYPRELIQSDLLNALNSIFVPDGTFTEVEVKNHDEIDSPELWEIYLGESKKGLVQLSNSGSGLKTVLLVLLNLLVVPKIKKIPKSEFCFAFEELENNLHPSLLRRLLLFLQDYAIRENCFIFLTTHSSTALDLFGVSKDAQIVHVIHDGESATARRVSAHFDHLGVISELGAKPSDLLQANGIIWVEGPSDCIYINRWLDIFSAGKFKQGRDYQCAFYGGSLLARTQFASPEEADKELVNLFRINPNIVVICDGDRSTPGSRLKERVRRIRAEVSKIERAHIWVTSAREIENYLPGSVLAKALGLNSLPDPSQHEPFFPRSSASGNSYTERRLRKSQIDKVDLAMRTTPHLSRNSMKSRFDLEREIQKIAQRIENWNKL